MHEIMRALTIVHYFPPAPTLLTFTALYVAAVAGPAKQK